MTARRDRLIPAHKADIEWETPQSALLRPG